MSSVPLELAEDKFGLGALGDATSKIVVHPSYEREAMPLALHHTPLHVSLGVFKLPAEVGSSSSGGGGSSSSSSSDGGSNSSSSGAFLAMAEHRIVLLTDPTVEEERAMDGKLLFSVNAHRELCSLMKPGGVSLSADTIVKATRMAAERAVSLHTALEKALAALEVRMAVERDTKLERLRKIRASQQRLLRQQQQQQPAGDMEVETDGDGAHGWGQGPPGGEVGGIDRDDPILQWNLLHNAAPVGED